MQRVFICAAGWAMPVYVLTLDDAIEQAGHIRNWTAQDALRGGAGCLAQNSKPR